MENYQQQYNSGGRLQHRVLIIEQTNQAEN